MKKPVNMIAPGILCLVLVLSCASSEPIQNNSQQSGEAETVETADNNNKLDAEAEAQELMTITAIPVMYGNEPRSYVAIVVKDLREETIYYVHPDMQEELRGMTGNRYEFTGYLYSGEQRFFDARLHDGVFVPVSWEAVD